MSERYPHRRKECFEVEHAKGRDWVNTVKRKQGYKRGYPVAVLVGFDDDHAVLWRIFSHVAKLGLVLKLGAKRTDKKALYNFHESVVDALRPVFKEGVKSVVVAAPMKTTYSSDFLDHVRKHHSYLIQSEGPGGATFTELIGSADQPHRVAELVKTREFRELITESTSQEANQVLVALEKHLRNSDAAILFSLKEIEEMMYDRKRSDESETTYLMLTDKYLADKENKNRLQRLLQISSNKGVKTRIVNAETPAGKRISQFGGIIYFTVPTR
jgi:stalled ribosome rescue protein Dom34